MIYYAKRLSYEDHLKAIAEKDALIKSLTERVHKYMAKYPNKANGCACLFDDAENIIQTCWYHKGKDAEIAELKKDLELNASMLAKQCDMAREAEAKLWEIQVLDREIKRLKERNELFVTMCNERGDEVKRLRSVLLMVMVESEEGEIQEIAKEALKENV